LQNSLDTKTSKKKKKKKATSTTGSEYNTDSSMFSSKSFLFGVILLSAAFLLTLAIGAMKLFKDKNKKTQPKLSLNTSTASLKNTDSDSGISSVSGSANGGKDDDNTTNIHSHSDFDDDRDNEHHEHNTYTNDLVKNKTSSGDIDSDDNQNLAISSMLKDKSINDEPDTKSESTTFLDRHPKIRKYVLPTLATLGVFALGSAASYYFFGKTDSSTVVPEEGNCKESESPAQKCPPVQNCPEPECPEVQACIGEKESECNASECKCPIVPDCEECTCENENPKCVLPDVLKFEEGELLNLNDCVVPHAFTKVKTGLDSCSKREEKCQLEKNKYEEVDRKILTQEIDSLDIQLNTCNQQVSHLKQSNRQIAEILTCQEDSKAQLKTVDEKSDLKETETELLKDTSTQEETFVRGSDSYFEFNTIYKVAVAFGLKSLWNYFSNRIKSDLNDNITIFDAKYENKDIKGTKYNECLFSSVDVYLVVLNSSV